MEPTGGELDQVLGEGAKQTREAQMYSEVLLTEDPVQMVFNSHLQHSFNHIPDVVGNMKSEWATI